MPGTSSAATLDDKYRSTINGEYASFFEQGKHSIALMYFMFQEVGLDKTNYEAFRERISAPKNKFCYAEDIFNVNFFDDNCTKIREALETRHKYHEDNSDVLEEMFGPGEFLKIANAAGIDADIANIGQNFNSKHLKNVKGHREYKAGFLVEIALRSTIKNYKDEETKLIDHLRTYITENS